MRFALVLIGYALLSAYGLYRLKAAEELVSFGFLFGAFCYGVGFLVWLAILRTYPLSLAFPAAAGALILATQLFGVVFLGERISWQAMMGSALIACGIALIFTKVGAGMSDKTERQREHFNVVADRYYSARRHKNHLLLKSLMWSDFLARHCDLRRDGLKVLEAMCGYADGKKILEDTLQVKVDYTGFDYSDEVVSRLRTQEPALRVFRADVGTVELEERYDLVVLLGGLHHVHHMAKEVVRRMAAAVRPGGFFLNLEPTSGNWLFTKVREAIYARNSLFDVETERAFGVPELLGMFQDAGLVKADIAYPGLLAYVLYYNPDAFPVLNIGGERCVRAAFALDRVFLRSKIGRAMSFATLSLWRRPEKTP